MTAQEMHAMTNEMKFLDHTIKSRFDMENYVYVLMRGLKKIGRNVLANDLEKLYDEMETIDTEEIIEMRTFVED